MKKAIIALLAVYSTFFANVYADSLHPDTFKPGLHEDTLRVKLQYRHGPIENSPFGPSSVPAGMGKTKLTVYSNGTVIKEKCMVGPNGCEVKIVDVLDKKELKKITALTKKASRVKNEIDIPFCEAIPFYHESMTAVLKKGKRDQEVVLYSGSNPCGGSEENPSDEAKELKEKLMELVSKDEPLHG